jgi:hypothetical protein
MKPLEKIYWLRLGLGAVVALICVGYGVGAGIIPHNPPLEGFPTDFRIFFNSMSIALVIYLISYYGIKSKFINQVEKPQKLLTTGIGVYFLSWIVVWTLLYTLIAGSPTL